MASYLNGPLFDVQAVQKLVDATKAAQSQSYTTPGPVTPSQPLINIPSIQPSQPQSTSKFSLFSKIKSIAETAKSSLAKVEASRYIQSKVVEPPKSTEVIQPFVSTAKTEAGTAIDAAKASAKPDHKVLYIGGGIAAVVIIALLMRKKAA